MHLKKAIISAGILAQSITGVTARALALPQDAAAAPAEGQAAPSQLTPDAKKEADGCGGSQWMLTPDNWKTHNTDEWFLKWWNEDPSGKASGMPLIQAFERKWLSKVGTMSCSLAKPCTAPICDAVVDSALLDKDPNTKEKSIQAYFVAHSLVNFNNWLFVAYNKVNEAQLTQNSMDVKMVNTFSTQRIPPPNHQSPFDLFMSLTSAIIGGLGLIPGLGTPASIVGTGLRLVSLGIASPGSTPVKVPTQLQKIGDLGAYVATFCDNMRTGLSAVRTQGFSGNPDGAGNDIFKILKDGNLLLWEDQSDQLGTYYTKQIRGRCLNQLMLSDSTYMVKAPAKGDDCNQDQGLKEEMKYCDPADMKFSYHIYQWDLNAGRYPPLRTPTGWDQLKNVLGIDLKEDIMASSVASYKAGGNIYAADQATVDLIAVKPAPELSSAGAFSIPICVSNDGSASSTYDKDDHGDGLRYPCRCGNDPSWNGARDFTVGDDDAIQLPDKPETRQFWHYARLDWQDWYTVDRDNREDMHRFCQDEQKDSFFGYDQLYTGKFRKMWPNAPYVDGWGQDTYWQDSGTPVPPARGA